MENPYHKTCQNTILYLFCSYNFSDSGQSSSPDRIFMTNISHSIFLLGGPLKKNQGHCSAKSDHVTLVPDQDLISPYVGTRYDFQKNCFMDTKHWLLFSS